MSDIKTVLTVDEVLDYLGIDYADDKVNRNITRAIATADKIIQGSVGVNYPVEDARSKELALIIVSDLYDIRGMTTRDNVSNNVRRLVEDMSLQLKLELGSDPYTPSPTPTPTPEGTVFYAPYIGDDDYWYLWDIDTNSYINSGVYARGIPGEKGEPGKNGTTPKKGIDYWTPEDKAEINSYIDEKTTIIATDIEGLQKQLNEEAHFRGYLSTNAKIQALEATPNDFAYSAESGTKWVYDAENGWQDTGKVVPDQLTPPSDAIPLINGKASPGVATEYARGDHRHPTDTTRASVEELNELKSTIELALDNIIVIQNELIGGGA